MADEQTAPTQQGADGESNHSQLMAMMLQLQASVDNMGRLFDNRVTESHRIGRPG